MTELTDRERAVLDLEGRVWKHAGTKEDAIRDLGMTPTRHYQVLNGLLDRADAWEYAPAALARARAVRNRQRHRRRAA
ncbi:DUF3263 domain-containing protein [Cellulomonas sp.]|uniref:DUF3263 domain-containing protein n=1 Tax=Cellulomonas sp. TaxID=40001 RepID=UPI002D252E8D|nr:DUF3263 domain-containing protein [Cellulomonas sp.]HYQ76178.1 DUF3263 domain-containing protein [Cellulomonas sp.]